MDLGYSGELYILAFDHRGSFTKRFGVEGDPTAADNQRFADGKHLIFEGIEAALARGADPSVTGALVDEQFGGPVEVPQQAKARGIKLAMPVEKSGQKEFDFEYGAAFGDHLERYDPDFSKVLVRCNPDGDTEMNKRQAERLRRLSDWLHANDRRLLFELLVPAEEDQLASVHGDAKRYDAELRPDLMVRAIRELQDAGIESDIWKIEASTSALTPSESPPSAARGDAMASSASCLVAAPTTTRSMIGSAPELRWMATSASQSVGRSGAIR